MRQKVYISGPITNGGTALESETEDYVKQAIELAQELLDAGFAVHCPHLTWYWEKHVGTGINTHENWLSNDYPWVLASDAVLRMHGDSTGADKEVELATRAGIPVFTSVESLREGLSGDGPCARATRAVYGQRGADYGHPYDDFSRTASYWSTLFGVVVSPEQVAEAMVLLKLSREQNRHKDDNLTDMCGYVETLNLVIEEKGRRETKAGV